MLSNDISNLSNQFLIAMPNMGDSGFAQTVTYICEHNENGAIGIVINKPLTITLKDVLKQIGRDDLDLNYAAEIPILSGGPVQQERGFVIHHNFKTWCSHENASSDELTVTTSKDILEAIALRKGPEKVLISLGYAGWRPGQLESEMMHNAWLNGPATDEILFELPFGMRWAAAAKLLGIDLNFMSGDVGHA